MINKHSFKTIPSHHPPKENLSDDSLHLPDEVSRIKISVKASPLEEPEETAMPKEIDKSVVANVTEIRPLLARFLNIFFEWGRGGLKSSKQTQWSQVGRLLYEVDEIVTNDILLWSAVTIHLRRTFIEGNHLDFAEAYKKMHGYYITASR